MRKIYFWLVIIMVATFAIGCLGSSITTGDNSDGDQIEGEVNDQTDGDDEILDGDTIEDDSDTIVTDGDTLENDNNVIDGDEAESDGDDEFDLDNTDGDSSDLDTTDGDFADGDTTETDTTDSDLTDNDYPEWDSTDDYLENDGEGIFIVKDTSMEFPDVLEGCCTDILEVRLRNIGDGIFSITKIEMPGNMPIEIKYSSLGDLPYRMYPGYYEDFYIMFCPETPGDYAGEIVIETSIGQTQRISLKGKALHNEIETDNFKQIARPQVDVLFVVDCSGSMAEEQETLVDSFEAFINDITIWDADYNFAVVSCDITDEDHSGKFQGSPKVLNSSEMSKEDLISAFQTRISNLGTSCDGFKEAGLDAAYLALSDPLISNYNAGFLRENAKLTVVFLSDEEDGSDRETSFYVNFLQNIKGINNPYLLEAYAIVGDEPHGCEQNLSGSRYISVADQCNAYNNKHFVSICQDEYSDAFGYINNLTLRNQFILSNSAEEDTITVMVNNNISTDWIYDADSNSVIFNLSSPPPADADIVVTYYKACETN